MINLKNRKKLDIIFSRYVIVIFGRSDEFVEEYIYILISTSTILTTLCVLGVMFVIEQYKDSAINDLSILIFSLSYIFFICVFLIIVYVIIMSKKDNKIKPPPYYL